MTQVWLIRNDTLSQELEEGGFISIGWDGTGDLNRISLQVDSLIADLRKRIVLGLMEGVPDIPEG